MITTICRDDSMYPYGTTPDWEGFGYGNTYRLKSETGTGNIGSPNGDGFGDGLQFESAYILISDCPFEAMAFLES